MVIMKNRIKNVLILLILILFLLFVLNIPVTCIFKSVTGISCPACGMTRAFISILHLNFLNAFLLNILSIPLFIFICISVIIMIIEIFRNKFNYIPKLLNFLGKYWYIFIILLIISFIWNNMRLI
jgi:hypothetical protein